MLSKYVMGFVEKNKPAFMEFILKNTRNDGAAVTIDLTTKKHVFVGSTIHILTENWLVLSLTFSGTLVYMNISSYAD
jgi:hypothetical protein